MSAAHASTRAVRRRKALAVLAGGLVLGIGATVTLAAWTDTEWVFGGNANGTGPGLGTSVFEIQQNVTSPFAAAGFVDAETNPGEALVFTASALSLSPGTSTYSEVALRSSPTSIAGTVALRAAVPASAITVNDPANALFNALQVRVAVSATPITCNAAAFATGSTIIANGALSSTGANASQTLAASAGSTEYYCFEVTLPTAPTLPAGTTLAQLQGRTVAPAWQFFADSV